MEIQNGSRIFADLAKLFLMTGLLVAPNANLGLAAEPQAPSGGRPLALETSVEMVLVPVTVTDHYGKTIEGLKAQNFTISDDGVLQRIASFATEDAPSSVGLVLDTSGSMRDTLGAAKEVIHAFLTTANSGDEFQLLTVSTEPEAVSGFTTDITALEEDVQSTRSAGFTALIDTVYLSLNRMRRGSHPRRALVVLSDGMDNHSRYSKRELMRVAIEADVQVYSVIFDNDASSATVPHRSAMIAKPWDHPQEGQGRDLLEGLAEKTGGLHFRARSGSERKEAATKIGQAIRGQYLIGYQPPHSNQPGKWHRIRVKAGVPNVSVYARSGYYSR